MNVKEIEKRIKEIENVVEDDEVAHIKEDSLYWDFVDYIAKTGNKDQRKKARMILRTKKFDFARWCA